MICFRKEVAEFLLPHYTYQLSGGLFHILFQFFSFNLFLLLRNINKSECAN